ncbi:MAG: LamG-like jellyroll fold domain-containing protein [Candidatus Kariarchaeaceae archaeon]
MTNAQNTTNWQIPYDVDEYTVALWQFDEASGSNVADASPNHYDGTASNTSIVSSISGFGNAREFIYDPPIWENIVFGNFNLPQYEGTIEFWIKPSPPPVPSHTDHSHFFVKALHGSSGGGFTFYIRIYNNGRFNVGVGDTGGDLARNFHNAITFYEWQHFRFVWTTNETRLYKNGELFGVDAPFPIGIGQTNHEVAMGKWGSTLFGTNSFVGLIDEFRISNIARDKDLVAYYPFNGNAEDESGHGNDGQIEGNLEFGEGACGTAGIFDGIDDWVAADGNGSLRITGPLTISTWIKINQFPSEYDVRFILVRRSAVGFQDYYGNFFEYPNNFTFHTESGTVPTRLDVSNAFIEGKWNHIVSWYNGTEKRVYINGDLRESIQVTGGLNSGDATFYIGANLPNNRLWKGGIDEIRVYGRALEESEILELYNECAPQTGNITGTVSVNGTGLENVTVKLLDTNEDPVPEFNDVSTNVNGEYSFNEVPEGDYQVMIVEPLGYVSDGNPKEATVVADETTIVDFNLTEVVVMNNARSKGYWKHQFDVYVRGRGNAQESEQDLLDYIALVQDHYNLHYDIFTDLTTLEEWQDVLSLRGNHPMVERAKQHLAALLMNMVSNKIGQYTVVTDDGRDVGDVIQHVSFMIEDGDDSNDELAKDLAESVNNQQTIAAGIVPEGDKLFKVSSETGKVLTYELSMNFPNPYNPTTTIKYQIPNAGFVTLKVYDVLGNEVATLVNESKEEGRYQITFDASILSSGVYIYQLQVNDYLSTKKMVLMK